jgi:hypothetical protein
MLIKHDDSFKEGVRILMLVSRRKDGCEDNRVKRYQSTSVEEFDEILQKLMDKMQPGQRIYASACPRDAARAVRDFKQKQLDNSYADDPLDFYLNIESRWKTSLMQKWCEVKSKKLFMFDCDTPEEELVVKLLLKEVYKEDYTYSYYTKNGIHILTKPFDIGRTQYSAEAKRLLKTNALMLWAY